MTTKQALHWQDGDAIVAVVPETCDGPGWHNRVVWVFIRSRVGQLRSEALQPEEQGDGLLTLFAVGEVASRALVSAVSAQLVPPTTL